MKSLFFILVFLTISCQHTSSFIKKEWILKKWVINTISESILGNRVFQNTPTLLTPQLIIQGDALYGVRAYNRSNGNLQWVLSVMGGVEGGIHQEKNRVFFGGSDGFFYSLEVSTGRVLWKFYTGSENLGAPSISNNRVYFVTSKDKLYVLDARTGKQLWVYQNIDQTTASLSIRGVSRPTVDQNKVYVGFSDGNFLAFNKSNGKVLWKQKLSKNTDIFKDTDSHPVVIGKLIYVSSYSGGIFCLNKETGKIIWRNSVGAYSDFTIDNRFIYYSTVDQQILVLNRFSGRKKWAQKLSGLATQPLVYKSTLIFGLSNGGLYVLNKNNGKKITEVGLFKGVTTRPTLDITNGELYVMSNEFWLYKFNLLF